ncbi:MAG: TIGR01212 family radical SAM protein [Enterocloster sp.]
MTEWNGKPYHSLDYELKKQFGQKIYKLSLDGGMTCPNRDGTLGSRGCIFCSEGGSGDFAEAVCVTVSEQIERAKTRVAAKMPENAGRYIAYFQSYTNTYAPLPRLRSLFSEAAGHPDIAALSVGTRPDCLGPETVRLLAELNSIKPLWVELGLQTIHSSTARFIRRGYELPVFEDALTRLKAAGLTVIVHVILGLPGESPGMMKETVSYLARRPVDGIKLQLLHILKGTDLADIYRKDPFPLFTMEEYIDLVIDCVEILPPGMTIHRITGDGPKSLLIAPLWSGNKRLVLNSLHKRFRERGTWQGKYFSL